MAARESRGLDDPPNSRLFILCQKGTTEQEFREVFQKYGIIEDVWIIKDKRTNEDRGKDNIQTSCVVHICRLSSQCGFKILFFIQSAMYICNEPKHCQFSYLKINTNIKVMGSFVFKLLMKSKKKKKINY